MRPIRLFQRALKEFGAGYSHPGDPQNAEMVKAFIISIEYRRSDLDREGVFESAAKIAVKSTRPRTRLRSRPGRFVVGFGLDRFQELIKQSRPGRVQPSSPGSS